MEGHHKIRCYLATATSLFIFLLFLQVALAIHEIAHYAGALIYDVWVSEISLGFGPVVASGELGGEQLVLRAYPIGAAVRLADFSIAEGERFEVEKVEFQMSIDPRYREQMAQENPVAFERLINRPRWFSSKPVGQRVVIVLLGPLANFAFGLAIAVVATLLRSGNSDNQGVSSNGSSQSVMPSANDNPIQIWLTSILLPLLVLCRKIRVEAVMGPVEGVISGTDSIRQGFRESLIYLCMIQCAIGTFNLLPIPVLDGGKLLFLALESLSLPVSPDLKSLADAIGIVVIASIVLLLSTNDVLRRVRARRAA